jgi:hypothetical protein
MLSVDLNRLWRGVSLVLYVGDQTVCLIACAVVGTTSARGAQVEQGDCDFRDIGDELRCGLGPGLERSR